MGEFLAATAFRTQDAEALCEATAQFYRENGRTLDRFAGMPDYFAEDPDSAETARLAAGTGWASLTRWRNQATRRRPSRAYCGCRPEQP